MSLNFYDLNMQPEEKKSPGVHYPGFTFHFDLIRDPTCILITIIFPLFIMDFLAYQVFDFDLHDPDRIANVGIMIIVNIGLL